MAATGGSSSILTQVQQGGPNLNTLAGTDRTSPAIEVIANCTPDSHSGDENLTLDLR